MLDSHIAIAIAEKDLSRYGAAIEQAMLSPRIDKIVSVASLWEIAIKYRLGKLTFSLPLEDWPDYFKALGFQLLPIDQHHAIEDLDIQPATRDPFDRLLLAQCQVEGLRLVTIDRVLSGHPLVWQIA
ncbi:MAG TPA: type II toxin-antitoxin system VapC family toxin [Rhizomicrobium sp.]